MLGITPPLSTPPTLPVAVQFTVTFAGCCNIISSKDGIAQLAACPRQQMLSNILSLKCICWEFCDIRDKNAVNQGFWSKTTGFSLPHLGLRTEDNLTPTEDTLADLTVLINSFGPH